MGDRFYLNFICSNCHEPFEAYYAESCGMTKEKCPSCGQHFQVVMGFSLTPITLEEYQKPDPRFGGSEET